jgi:hypothetical protein
MFLDLICRLVIPQSHPFLPLHGDFPAAMVGDSRGTRGTWARRSIQTHWGSAAVAWIRLGILWHRDGYGMMNGWDTSFSDKPIWYWYIIYNYICALCVSIIYIYILIYIYKCINMYIYISRVAHCIVLWPWALHMVMTTFRCLVPKLRRLAMELSKREAEAVTWIGWSTGFMW